MPKYIELSADETISTAELIGQCPVLPVPFSTEQEEKTDKEADVKWQ